jgi:formylmethanofuran dehydrogenase subunit C
VRPLTLRLKAKPPCLVDAAALRPQALAGLSREAILRVALPGWNQSFAVGELFSVSGDDAGRVVLDGVQGSLIRVGASLEGGELTVSGHAGDYAGEAMRGGTLVVDGHAGDYLGAGMRAGKIRVSGNAGAFAGSGRAGAMTGMSGGSIVISGSAGERAGDRMRRGLLLIEGGADRYCAARMIAGTIVALGQMASHAGYLMRRGTLMLADASVEPLPTFNDNGVHELLAIRLLLESFSEYGPAFRRFARHQRFRRWLGDLGCGGQGEILVAADRVDERRGRP